MPRLNVKPSSTRTNEICIYRGNQIEAENSIGNSRTGVKKSFSFKRASSSLVKGLKAALIKSFRSDSGEHYATKVERTNTPETCQTVVVDSSPGDAGLQSNGLGRFLKRLKVRRRLQAVANRSAVDSCKGISPSPDTDTPPDAIRSVIENTVRREQHATNLQQDISISHDEITLDASGVLNESDQHVIDHRPHATTPVETTTQFSEQSTELQRGPNKRSGSGYNQIWSVLFNNDPAQVFGTWNGSKVWDYSGSYDAVCRQVLPRDEEECQHNTKAAATKEATNHPIEADGVSIDGLVPDKVDISQDGRSAEELDPAKPELEQQEEQGTAEIHNGRETTTSDSFVFESEQQIRSKRVFEIVQDLEDDRRESIARFADLGAEEAVPTGYSKSETSGSSEVETSEGNYDSPGSESSELDDGQGATHIEMDEATSESESGGGFGGEFAAQHDLVIANDPDVWIKVFNVVKVSADLPLNIFYAQRRVIQELKFRANQR